jgi:predicted ATP-binding protein involved in virulence
MRIDSLTLQNFRKFDQISCDFDKHLTVLIGANGDGKTTLLDAVRIALLPFIKGFDLGSQTGKSATIQLEDVRRKIQDSGNMEPQLPSSITALGNWDKEEWTQTRESVRKNTNTLQDKNTKKFNKYAQKLQEKSRSGEEVVLPLITYLGTSRLWYQGRYRAETSEITLDVNDYSRTSGYLNCLSYTSSFKAFADWYGWICRSYDEARLRAWENKTPLDVSGQRFEDTVKVIQSSVDSLVKEMTGWHSLRFSSEHHQQLVMQHPTEGTLPVDMLSDGLRNMIAMIADIAFRSYKLNPQFGKEAALKTPGIALIDEVDMFLHPQWQQTVLASLRNAFPEIQFIVTTHSPQVLTTIGRENIRVLTENAAGEMVAQMPRISPLGHESGDALSYVMQVPVRPTMPFDDYTNTYEQMVRNGDEEMPEAQAIKKRLDELGYEFSDSDLQTWRFLASRKKVNT